MCKEIRSSDSRFLIVPADSSSRYEALRGLWCSVFGDTADYVDSMFECFGDEMRGFIVVENDSHDCVRALSALVCYRCGELSISDADMEEVCGKPVYVSYAICTDPAYRGMGLAGELTSYVRDMVTDSGGLSLVSPADESLQSFYAGLGYRPYFYVNESIAYADEAAAGFPDFGDDEPGDDYFDGFYEDKNNIEELWPDDDSLPFEPALDIRELDAGTYNRYREAFLIDEPHIVLSDKMIEFALAESLNGSGLLAVNGGDAICAVTYAGSAEDPGNGRLVLAELIVNPVLEEISAEIGSEIAGRLARHFGAALVEYREPGMRSCQAMLAGRLAKTEAGMPKAAYFGFPFD